MEIHESGELFQEVQNLPVFEDGKTFPDCLHQLPVTEIVYLYNIEKRTPGFDLKLFIHRHFDSPPAYLLGYKSDPSRSIIQHIHVLWDILTRQPIPEKSSLVQLPYPYVVPGGRFREIYYWDSYFTQLGLIISHRNGQVEEMINNFTYLIDQFGYIPNGNRTYFIGRSQPPFYSLMIRLLAGVKGKTIITKYISQLEKEYLFWMKGSDQLTSTISSLHRVVRMSDGTIMNRYWDENDSPRPEAYREDIELSHQSSQYPSVLFRHLRAAAESGWDFSSRWFREPGHFHTIHTTDIVPIDLNCLLLHLEETLAEGFALMNNAKAVGRYLTLAAGRKDAIQKYCWSEKKQFYFDYDFVEDKQKEHLTLASGFPLFFNVSSPFQAASVARVWETQFLKTGGLTTTLHMTGQQWDAPNGWAPLQWICYQGLMNYQLTDLAKKVRSHWINANMKVYEQTGKMTEKYDVWNENASASGGEYPNQDGFGWTNGVFLAMEKSF